MPAKGNYDAVYTVILTIHMNIVHCALYSLIGVTESVDEPTEY